MDKSLGGINTDIELVTSEMNELWVMNLRRFDEILVWGRQLVHAPHKLRRWCEPQVPFASRKQPLEPSNKFRIYIHILFFFSWVMGSTKCPVFIGHYLTWITLYVILDFFYQKSTVWWCLRLTHKFFLKWPYVGGCVLPRSYNDFVVLQPLFFYD